MAKVLKPGGRLLVSEPRLHVSESEFSALVAAGEEKGLREEARPQISGSRSVVFVR